MLSLSLSLRLPNTDRPRRHIASVTADVLGLENFQNQPPGIRHSREHLTCTIHHARTSCRSDRCTRGASCISRVTALPPLGKEASPSFKLVSFPAAIRSPTAAPQRGQAHSRPS
jgi:hypothetical protein